MATVPAECNVLTAPAEVRILGVAISALNMEEALERTERLIEQSGRGYICVTGVHGIMEAQACPEFRQILNGAFLAVPDGMPAVWIGHIYGHREMGRVYGPELMVALCDRSRRRGYRHFLYGAGPGVVEQLRQRLVSRYPGLEITGTYTPPFRPLTPAEEAQLLREIAAARPHVVWVGLSTPKQERFMHELLPRLEPCVMIGVGAAFDIHTDRLRDAPDWVKSCGMQWLHRLAQEPRRLARRYLINNPLFLVKMAGQLLTDWRAGVFRAKSQGVGRPSRFE